MSLLQRDLTRQSLSERRTQPKEIHDGLQSLKEEELLCELSQVEAVKKVELRGPSFPQNIHLPPG